jgi:hypothetical protein
MLLVLAVPAAAVAAIEVPVDLVAVLTVAPPMDIGPPFSCIWCLWTRPVAVQEFGQEGVDPAPLPPGEYFFAAALEEGDCWGAVTVRLDPEGGTWTMPVFVQRTYPALSLSAEFEDATGTSGPVLLGGDCSGPDVLTWDLVVLPLGTGPQGFSASLVLPGIGSDADAFPSWLR